MMRKAAIRAIEYYLPPTVLSNEELAVQMPGWTADKITEKTGIQERRVVQNECASDLAISACRKLFASGACEPCEIDYVLLCTQSPDYFLPTTACLLQSQLGLRTGVGALDFNLGCSGFVYGLGLAQGLVETGQAQKVLLLTAETYTKYLHPKDRSVRTIFGDGAAATLIEADERECQRCIGPFVFGTDGSGAENLIVPVGGTRRPRNGRPAEAAEDEHGNWRTPENLFMDGPEIFAFALRVVPNCVAELLTRSGKSLDEIDLFVFHQANRYMLEHLRRRMGIPREKFVIAMENYGNTVSSTIPIALRDAQSRGMLKSNSQVLMVGFGVGYSWSACLARWV